MCDEGELSGSFERNIPGGVHLPSNGNAQAFNANITGHTDVNSSLTISQPQRRNRRWGLNFGNVKFDLIGLPPDLRFTQSTGANGFDVSFNPAGASAPEPGTPITRAAGRL